MQVGTSEERAFQSVARRVSENIIMALTAADTTHEVKLFSVSTEGLFEIFLDTFSDPIERQQHNCNCCRHFIKHYGGLVTLTKSGGIKSVTWNTLWPATGTPLPHVYQDMLNRLQGSVVSRPVIKQFLWTHAQWGTKESGGFSHFSALAPRTCKIPEHLTEGQAMADQVANRRYLEVATNEMNTRHVHDAIGQLEAGGLQRSENLLPMARFLRDVQQSTSSEPRGAQLETQNRIFWYFVGQAAPGWCTPKSSAFGALVDDIAHGRSLGALKAAHNERVAPLNYQRPKAAPTAGNLKQAETIFEKMDLAPALKRRAMALEEAQVFWVPRSSPPKPAQPTTGLFAHIKPKEVPNSSPTNYVRAAGPPNAITFVKFQRDYLPKALKLRIKPPMLGNFCAFTTAVDPEAPPLMKWDNLAQRNPGSWYLYADGSSSNRWNLSSSQWVDVEALCKLPPEWFGNAHHDYQTNGRVLLVLKNCRDLYNKSLVLFPEHMRNELHSVRSTIEAHSKSGSLTPEPRQWAAGYLLGERDSITIEVHTVDGHIINYTIDRLE